jgi:hypothetical protein
MSAALFDASDKKKNLEKALYIDMNPCVGWPQTINYSARPASCCRQLRGRKYEFLCGPHIDIFNI